MFDEAVPVKLQPARTDSPAASQNSTPFSVDAAVTNPPPSTSQNAEDEGNATSLQQNETSSEDRGFKVTEDGKGKSFYLDNCPVIVEISPQVGWVRIQCDLCEATIGNDKRYFRGISGLMRHLGSKHKDINSKKTFSRDYVITRCIAARLSMDEVRKISRGEKSIPRRLVKPQVSSNTSTSNDMNANQPAITPQRNSESGLSNIPLITPSATHHGLSSTAHPHSAPLPRTYVESHLTNNLGASTGQGDLAGSLLALGAAEKELGAKARSLSGRESEDSETDNLPLSQLRQLGQFDMPRRELDLKAREERKSKDDRSLVEKLFPE